MNSTKVATAVSRHAWNGVADTSKNATQATDARRPTINLADGAYGSRNTLSFTGASTIQLLQSGAWTTGLSQPCTQYVVCSGSNKVSQRLATDGIGAANRNAVYYTSGGLGSVFAGSTVSGAAIDDDVSRVLCGVFNGASSAIYLSNASTGTTGNAGAQTLTGITVGSDYAITQGWNGKIAAVLVYSGAHTTAQRQLIMGYLGAQYGITVTP
jgi:hypothetical protein